MSSSNVSLGAIDLSKAIHRNPLIVSSQASVIEAIAMMSQARNQSCQLIPADSIEQQLSANRADCSCVLVMENSSLLGIFTERDIVHLTAQGKGLEDLSVAEVMATPVVSLTEDEFQDIFAALFLFRRFRIRHLPIFDSSGGLSGIVSPESIRRVLQPANLLKLRRVSEIMSKAIIQAELNTSVLSAAQLMSQKRVSCVVITETLSDKLIPVGILTERDIVQFQSLGINLDHITVQEVMSTPLFLLRPEDSLWYAHQEMQKRHVRRLVVSWDWGQGMGIVTQTSLLKVFDPMEMYGVIDSLQRTIKHLTINQSKAVMPESSDSIELPDSAMPPQNPQSISSSHSQDQSSLVEYPSQNQAKSSLSQLENLLQQFLSHGLTIDQKQQMIESALAEIKQLRQLIVH